MNLNSIASSRLLSTREAASLLGVRAATLKRWRQRTCKNGQKIRYLRLGRSIRYRETDVLNWIASRPEAA
jgi:excisionase family DNA binding protein